MTDPEEDISDNSKGQEELMEGIEEGTDSDSDDESLDDRHEEELRIKVKEFRKQLEGNELYYDGHVNLIAALRELFELEEARKARQAMSKIYPLTPELWLEWIRDEQKVCTTNDERQFIVELFESAVKDYSSVQLWVEYVMFMLGSGDMVATRAVGELGLTSVGTHVAEGVLVWQVVLLVEKQIYAALQKPGATHSEQEIKEQEKQLCRIQGLFRRQMRVPLMNCDADSLLQEASQYFEGDIEPQMKEDLKKTQKKLNEKTPFEEELLRAENDVDKLASYRRYIIHTKETDNPAAVQSLYERAVTDHCLDAGLWEEYVRFVMQQFHGLDYVVLPVCERSQRNCPWSATLCELHITALQIFATQDESVATKIKGALEKGLGCGVQSGSEVTRMWMAYLIFLRRQIIWDQPHDTQLHALREAGHQAISMIDKYFGDEGDIDSDIPRFLARIEAEYAHDQEKAREMWNDIVMKRNNNFKNGNFWLEFINMERSYGSEKYCRKLYRRALERVWDWVEVIGSSYLRFEQEAGTLESMQDFIKRYDDRLAIVSKKRAEDAAKLEAEKQAENEMHQRRKHKGKPNKWEWNKSLKDKSTVSHSEESGVFKVPLPVTRTDKASKHHMAANASSKSSNTPGTKNSTFLEPKSVTTPPGYTDDVMPPPGFKVNPRPYPDSFKRNAPLSGVKDTITPPPGFKDDEPNLLDKGSVTPPPGYRSHPALPGGFKDNVAPSPSQEEKIEPPPGFKPESPPSAGATVREAKISGGEPPAKKLRIEEQYGVLTEKDSKDELCTVFLSNLDYSTGNDEIIPVFSGCGEIASFRLVKDYKFRSKGFGYLVFKTHDAAVKSLKLDRTLINGRPVFVSSYDPEGHAHKFTYSLNQEKEKLFVRGLPFSMTENDVREAFQPHGKIKNIRLVTYRNGHSKGTCYIDYYDSETAQKVRQAMDGANLGDKVISVLISDPSAKKSSTRASSPREGSSFDGNDDPDAKEKLSNKDTSTPKGGILGGGIKGKKVAGIRGKGMFSLMPRAVVRAHATSSTGVTETSSVESQGKKMSNEDFRSMLLKK